MRRLLREEETHLTLLEQLLLVLFALVLVLHHLALREQAPLENDVQLLALVAGEVDDVLPLEVLVRKQLEQLEEPVAPVADVELLEERDRLAQHADAALR